MEIPNENYWEEKRRQREKNSPNAPSPLIVYYMHGSGTFVFHHIHARLMRFDNLERGTWSNAARSRDNFIGTLGGGQLRSEPLSGKYTLIANSSGITQEQIDFIRQIGGAVTLSRAHRDYPQGSLPLYFYFISNSFYVNDE
jgi:hypothetical protein